MVHVLKKLVLIDGNALVHRAFHALPPLTSPHGVMTNAVYGFFSVLLKMLKELKPEYVAATFDLAGPTFRHEEFAEYKEHRVKAPDELYAQIPIVKELLGAFGIPIFEKQSYEADDVIGSLAEQAKKRKNLQVVIMTGDLDTLQLVDKDRVVVFTLKKGVTDTVLYDEKGVRERYGFDPEFIPDFKGLRGDPSDNIPGVPGIGEKTASALIQSFGSLEQLYKGISNFQFPISKKQREKLKPPLTEKLIQKLLEHREVAFFSKKLATIICSIEVDFTLVRAAWQDHLDRKALEDQLKSLSLYNIVKRLPEVIKESPGKPDIPQASDASLPMSSASRELDLGLVLKHMDPKVAAVVLIEDSRVLFGTSQEGTRISSASGDIGRLQSFLEDGDREKVTHDAKALYAFGLAHGILICGIVFDTKLAAYLLQSDRRAYDLPRVYFDEFQLDMASDASGVASGVLKLQARLSEKIRSAGLNGVLKDIELPVSVVLADMERNGVLVDRSALDRLSRTVGKELTSLEQNIHRLAGVTFNVNSPQQLSQVLFERLGLKGRVRKTGKGARSTAAGELEKLSTEHPIVEMVLRYRELQKLKTTYIEPFPALLNAKTGRVHTTYNQTGTSTGRLASENPNLQNIPIRTELGQEFRKAFVAGKGCELVSFDYSQLELRIVAHLAQDKKMIAAFRDGEDIHLRTAAEIFGVRPDEVTPSMRREAKTLNFGILYGMGQFGFQRAAGVGRDAARGFIDRYMTEFSGVAAYMDRIKREARTKGYVTTLFGRRRQLPDILSTMPGVVRQAERMAINMPVQGTGADLMKLAMIRVHEWIRGQHHEENIRMLLQVHDELLCEIRKDLVQEVWFRIKETMEGVYILDASLVVDVKAGSNWAEMKELHRN